MSSPNACGCITLLLSAARGSQMKVSTAAIRRAIQNSAKFCEGVDVLGQGYGLLQVDQAWKMLQRYQQDNELDMLHYKVTVLGDRFKRGIYLRGDAETSVKDTYKVQVDAIFRAQDIPSSKINFEKRLTNLECNLLYTFTSCSSFM